MNSDYMWSLLFGSGEAVKKFEDMWAMKTNWETLDVERKLRGFPPLSTLEKSLLRRPKFRIGMYKSYVIKHHPSLAENMMTKVFWHHVFYENNIPQPRMHATCIGGHLTTYTAEDDESPTGYIVKPNKGSLGRGVERATACPDCNRGSDWVCQERVVNCGEYTEHYRVVTLWDGRVFSVSLMQSGVPGAVTSNLSQGGTSEMLCFGNGCHLAYPDAVREISEKLATMHTEGFNVVFSIGWDVIVACDPDGNPGRAFALEGNLMNNGKQWSKEANDAYRNDLKRFLAMHPEYL